MMFSIRENADGILDFEVKDGVLVMVDGAEMLRQHIEIRLRLWRGELFYNVDDGVDYADLVFPALDRNAVLGELRRVVLGTPGVTSATLELVSDTPDKIVVRGQFIGNLEVQNDLIRAEFGPIEIQGG